MGPFRSRATDVIVGTIIRAVIVLSIAFSAFPASAAHADDFTGQVVTLINAERSHRGLGTLVISPELTASAQGYAGVMAAGGFVSHVGPDGSTLVTRDEAAGFHDWTLLGENLAAGQSTAADVVQAWMNSPEHRDNILSPDFREIGAGFTTRASSQYRYYWALEFGSQATDPAVFKSTIINPPATSGWTAPTGHLVYGEWLTYLHDHGDVDTLGLPRSNVVADPATGQSVQFFQRDILEYHPENPAGARIERRLLGDILYPGADPALSPADAPPGPSAYFPVTPGQPTGLGHFVANYTRSGQAIYFKEFFDSHGGVATFGFPKEEPKLRNGFWTQRFQAATFEYHPEFDQPGYIAGTTTPLRQYRVQLELLGDEYLKLNGLPYR